MQTASKKHPRLGTQKVSQHAAKCHRFWDQATSRTSCHALVDGEASWIDDTHLPHENVHLKKQLAVAKLSWQKKCNHTWNFDSNLQERMQTFPRSPFTRDDSINLLQTHSQFQSAMAVSSLSAPWKHGLPVKPVKVALRRNRGLTTRNTSSSWFPSWCSSTSSTSSLSPSSPSWW